DWLLGQQPEADAERTRAAVARNGAARDWATAAAERLRELGGASVPEIPAADESDAPRPRPRPLRDDAPPAARPRPVREEPAGGGSASGLRASKLGGAILIAVLVVVVGGLIAFIVTRGDDTKSGEPAASSGGAATATPTPTATATGNDIVLQGV